MLDIVLTVSSSLPTSAKVVSSLTFFANNSCSRLIVCSGWRKSWLAAAKNRDLPRLACSACRLAASNASAVRLRSVMSSSASRIFRVVRGSSQISSALTSSDRIPRARQVDVDFVILDDSLAVPEAVEEAAQRRDIEAALIDRVELPAHGLLGLDRKGAVEGAAGGDDVKLVVEHNQRLANGVDDALRVGPGCLDCPFGLFPLGYVGKGDNHARDPSVLGAVGQNATGVPAPSSASTSRFGGTWPARTAPASASRRVSLMRRARSASGRPTSVAMTRNSDLAAGVKKRILSSRSRNRVATSELSRMFCRSLDVLRWRSSVS